MSRLATVLLMTPAIPLIAFAAPHAAPAALTPAGSDDPLVQRAWSLVNAGEFTQAEQLLAPAFDAAAPATNEAAALNDIIQRIRRDFSLTEAEMHAKLQRFIPDVTLADIQRWRDANDLQHRTIDGELRYFNREPTNLFLFCKDAQQRRPEVADKAGWKWDRARHFAHLVELAKQSDTPAIYPVKHQVRYTLSVKPEHPRLREGAVVRAWLPFPQEYQQQRDVKLIRTTPTQHQLAPNGYPQRTIYFEQRVADPNTPPSFTAEFEFTTSAWAPRLDPAKVQPYDTTTDLYRHYTAERLPHIVFTPEVRQLAETLKRETPLETAQAIFRWCSKNIPWNAEMEYSTLPSLTKKGLAARRGDCGVQSLVFISICRAAGIPARWQSGFETKPNGWNLHDWSEIYIEPWGWLPADASYGVVDHPDPDVQTFLCGGMDPYRMIVNLDYNRELRPAKTSFRSEPYDFQRGEVEIDGHNLYFGEWNWKFELTTTPLNDSVFALGEALDNVIPDALSSGNVPGAVLAVGRKQADGSFTTWTKAYGHLRSEPQPMTMPQDAIFDLASLTKPIATATAVMQLVEAGKLELDAPVSRYLGARGATRPAMGDGDGSESETHAFTVRQLLAHTSGLPPYLSVAEREALIKHTGTFACRDALRAHVRAMAPQDTPDAAMTYSCLNAIMLAELVEAVSDQPLDAYTCEHIFTPLAMHDTGFRPWPTERSMTGDDDRVAPTTKAAHSAIADDYLRGRVHDPLAAMQSGVSGNAGLFGTADDLARYAQMLLSVGELDGRRVLTASTIRQMTSEQTGTLEANRGLGWALYPVESRDSSDQNWSGFGHTGYTGTAIRIYPKAGVYVIVLTNRVHPDDTAKVDDVRSAAWETVRRVWGD